MSSQQSATLTMSPRPRRPDAAERSYWPTRTARYRIDRTPYCRRRRRERAQSSIGHRGGRAHRSYRRQWVREQLGRGRVAVCARTGDRTASTTPKCASAPDVFRSCRACLITPDNAFDREQRRCMRVASKEGLPPRTLDMRPDTPTLCLQRALKSDDGLERRRALRQRGERTTSRRHGRREEQAARTEAEGGGRQDAMSAQ